jgi:hypothetical protein
MTRMRSFTAAALGVVLLAGGAAAQKLEVKSEIDPKADFATIRTYAWLPPTPVVRNVAPDAVSNPNLSNEVLGPHIVAAIDRQLAARGLVKAGQDDADVHVVYVAAMTSGVDSDYLGQHYGYITGYAPGAIGHGPATSASVYQQGTIVVDVVQRAAKRGIWRGSVVTRVAQERKLEDRIKRINEAMERVFQRFPIQPQK